MLFNTFGFIFLFLPVTLAGFFCLARLSRAWAAIWLAGASLFFYASWDYRYLPLLLSSIIFNYLAGALIGQSAQPQRKRFLATAVSVNLALLGYFKYADFFLLSAGQVLGAPVDVLGIVLPIGISFFTFTQIAYLVDTYQGKVKEYKFVHYLLFVTYFPHLIAGPVLHHKEMMPQFAEADTYRLRADNIAIGLSIFIIGLAKKVIIADNVAPIADPVFEPGANPALIEAWIGAIAYALQLYFDFSGYSDMAIGLSRMFGVRLPLNFNSPYKADSIVEFWRRWHMTLSRFLRDYLYVPMGGNRNGAAARYRNLLVTMLLGGLWHGAGWTYVVWGGLHGLYLVVNHLWSWICECTGVGLGRGLTGVFLRRSLTLLAVLVAWVFFRAPDLATAIDVLSAMAGGHGVSLPAWLQSYVQGLAASGVEIRFEGIRWVDLGSIGPFVMFLALLLALFAPNTQEIMANFNPCLEAVKPAPSRLQLRWAPSGIWTVPISLALLASILSLNRVTAFLYFQF